MADNSRAPWRRPQDSGPFPREWDRFEGPRPMPDGRKALFWIRDLSEDVDDEAVSFMHSRFLREEQMAKVAGTADDPLSSADMEKLWRDSLQQRVSLAAFSDWPDGRPRLVGLNMLSVARPDDPVPEMQGAGTAALFVLYNEMLSAADVFARYGVSCYLAGMGLSVATEYRGQGLGLHLLNARQPLCAALRIPLTVTLFSGAQSQKQAERAGFEELVVRRYADFALEDGSRPFVNTTWPCAKLKAKFYGTPRGDGQ